MQYTPEQQRAIFHHDHNMIVTAGAGSGKTSVLVARFMALLDANPEWSLLNIVAITFTEKAAREMRERIRDAIRDRISKSIPDDERQRWLQYEHQLDSARISTIHGLCSRILRANPVEAGLDPRFDVLDEVEAATLQDEVVERVLAEAVQSGATWTDLLPEYEVRTVRSVLKSFIALGWLDDIVSDEQQFDPDYMANQWQSYWEWANTQTITTLREHPDLADALDKLGQDFPIGDKLTPSCEVAVEACNRLQHGSLVEAVDAVAVLASEIKLQGGTQSNWGSKERVGDIKDSLRTIRELAGHAGKTIFAPLSETDEQALYYTQQWREAILSVRQAYQRTKADRQALDFDDLEQMTRDLLQTYPHVARRYHDDVHGEFKHVMVDEFQDTNETQRDIIYALCGFRDQHPPAGRLFVVGDPKQSIYAFRGADVSVFQRVSREIQAARGELVNLNRSFRTHERLVSMFNALFEQIMAPSTLLAREYSVQFEPMEAQRPAAVHHQEPLQLIVIEPPREQKLSSEEKRAWEADEVAHYLRAMVADGLPVYDKKASEYVPVQYAHMALLLRAMSNVHLFEDAFQRHGMPYLTVAGRGYFDQQEVYDLRNLLRAIHNPADDLSLAAALRSPLFNFSDDLLLTLRQRRDKPDSYQPISLWSAIFWTDDPLKHWLPLPEDELPRIDFARGVLQVLRGMSGRVTIGELLHQALDMTGFEAILTSLEHGERRRANALKFLEVARESQRVSLSAFNAYLADIVAANAREGEATLETGDAITLMTVHKSKGLEYPVVVLADGGYGGGNFTEQVMVTKEYGLAAQIPDSDDKPFIYQLNTQFQREREDEEAKRLLYVGATRAQDYLIISGYATTRGNNWLNLVRRIVESENNACSSEAYIFVPEQAQTFSGPIERQGENNSSNSTETPLMEQIRPQVPPVRHINASDLEILGDRARFRRQVLRGQPMPIRPITLTEDDQVLVSPFVLGRIVHRAIEMNILTSNPNFTDLLKAYAWEEGVNHQDAIASAVRDASQLLRSYEQSDVRKWLSEASVVHRELPFAFEKGAFMIHGIIDTLMLHKGVWKVIDYKTDAIRNRNTDYLMAKYSYQMGAYAEAVRQIIGHMPVLYLHFLRTGVTREMPTTQWQQALETMDLENILAR